MNLMWGDGGHRLDWSEVPAGLRAAVDDLLGAPVVRAATQSGGFSPGAAARVVLADSRRVFVKAAGAERNRDAADVLRREGDVLSGLSAVAMPAGVGIAELLAVVDDGDWTALVLADVDGRRPALPWREDELARVFDALGALSGALTPAPLRVRPTTEAHVESFGMWRALAADPDRAAGLSAWALGNLDRLAELESGWAGVAGGDTLLHGDLRADNLLLTDDRVVVVDWPHVTIGAPWNDALFMMPSVLMQGVTEPERWWDRHPAALGVPPGHVDAGLAAITGFFLGHALLPAVPGLPNLRAFQRAQGDAALSWLRARLA